MANMYLNDYYEMLYGGANSRLFKKIEPIVLEKADNKTRYRLFNTELGIMPSVLLESKTLKNRSTSSKFINGTQITVAFEESILDCLNDRNVISEIINRTQLYFDKKPMNYAQIPVAISIIYDKRIIDKTVYDYLLGLYKETRFIEILAYIFIIALAWQNNLRNIDLTANSNNSLVIEKFIEFADDYVDRYSDAILSSQCKWGAFYYSKIPQNTNVCEGLLSILAAKKNNKNVVNNCLKLLENELSSWGLVSKTLHNETVVATSMYIILGKLLNQQGYNIDYSKLEDNLWNAHNDTGWGLYIKDMDTDTNIGCTYWALKALENSKSISKEEYYQLISLLFLSKGMYSFGNKISTVNPKLPNMYSTSMMYSIFTIAHNYNQELCVNYNYEKAIAEIISSFDNPRLLVEQEGINGVNYLDNASVYALNWNHMSFHYCLCAISDAIKNKHISVNDIPTLLERIENVITDNSECVNNKLFWIDPLSSSDNGEKGIKIFPTMHIIMGLVELTNTLKESITK